IGQFKVTVGLTTSARRSDVNPTVTLNCPMPVPVVGTGFRLRWSTHFIDPMALSVVHLPLRNATRVAPTYAQARRGTGRRSCTPDGSSRMSSLCALIRCEVAAPRAVAYRSLHYDGYAQARLRCRTQRTGEFTR